MADVVAVHGIFMNRSSRDEMHETWLAELRRGLRNLRFARADKITLECAFFGHEYNDGKSGYEIEYTLGDLSPGLEEELLISFAESVGDPANGGTSKAGYAPRSVQWALVRLQERKFFDGVSARILRFVKQAARYLQDADFARTVKAEFGQAMEQRPRVVIAHSLGSVVAYDWLRSHPPTAAATLITMGSPLGLRSIIKALHPHIDACPAPWPVGIETWTNIAATEDVVASVKKLDGLFAGKIDDQPASNGRGDAHDALAYLRNVRLSRAVRTALE